MTYRDDHEAIHQRVQQLEQDLERAEAEATGRKEAQAEVERLHRALARAQHELERLKRPEPPAGANVQKRRLAIIAAVAAGVLFTAGALMVLLFARAPSRVVTPVTAPTPRPATPVPVTPPVPSPAPKPTLPKKAEAEPQTEGGLDRRVIQRVIRRHIGEVQRCYERELEATPGLSGVVSVNFTIGGTGRVVAAHIESSTLKNLKVEGCIVKVTRALVFPAAKDGKPVTVSYPFVLRVAG